MYVLPAVRLDEEILDRVLFVIPEVAIAEPQEVCGVHRGLPLHDAIDGADEVDQVADRGIPFLGRQPGIDAPPLELIQNHVLTFVAPVKTEDVLEQGRERDILVDAVLVVALHE